MDIFTQKKLLVRIIIVLAVLNFCSIGVFVWKVMLPPPRPGQEAPADTRDVSAIMERELNLTREQVDRIRSLRADFAEKERQLTEAIRSGRDSMNTEMFKRDTREETVRSLARKISDHEYKMELLRWEQARAMKSICTPQQVEKFEKLIREMRDYFRPDNRPGREQKRNPPKRGNRNQ